MEIFFRLAILLCASRVSFLAQVRELPRNAEPSVKMSSQPRFPFPVSKTTPAVFSQKAPSCRLRCCFAITTLLSNKNAFNAILEGCFFDRFSKKLLFPSDVLPSVPRGTISGFLKRIDHRGEWPVRMEAFLRRAPISKCCKPPFLLCGLLSSVHSFPRT